MAVLKPLLSARRTAAKPRRRAADGHGPRRSARHRQEPGLHDGGRRGLRGARHRRGPERREVHGGRRQVSTPTIIGMSALLTTTMTYMKTVIDGFEAAGQGHIKMAVGGAPISQMFADEIGADGYGAERLGRRRPVSAAGAGSRRDAWRPIRSSTGRRFRRRSRPRTRTATSACRCRRSSWSGSMPWPPSAAWRARTTTWRNGTGAKRSSARDRRRTSPQAICRELEAAGRLVEEPCVPVSLTINGRTTSCGSGLHAVRMRGGSRNPRAHLLPHERQMQGVRRRDRGGHGDLCRRPPRRSRTSRRRSGCHVRQSSRRRAGRSGATRCAAGRCASSGTDCTFQPRARR